MSATQNPSCPQPSTGNCSSSASLYLFNNISHISHPSYYSGRPSTTNIDDPTPAEINQSRLRVLHWLFNLSQTDASYPSINSTYSGPAFAHPLMPSNRAKL